MTIKKYLFTLTALLFCLSLIAADEKVYDPTRWEETIQKFLEQDKNNPPPENPILFVGSSSIRMWDVDKYFPDKKVINRGFGGSHMEDVLYYLDKIVLPYKPSVIFLYEGDNDIAWGKSPELVLDHFKQIATKVHEALPKTELVFISIKFCNARWDKAYEIARANELIRTYALGKDWLHYLDLAKPLIGDNNRPNDEFFLDDKLHLNDKGYEVWTALVNQLLEKMKQSEK